MFTTNKSLGLSVLTAGILAVAGCGGSNDGSALLTVKVTDAPVDDATSVVIAYTGIELQPTGAPTFSIDFCAEGQPVDECAQYINMLDFQDGDTFTLLEDYELEAGQYNWIRLKVLAEQNNSDGSLVTFGDGSEYPLWIPSGSETGLKIVKPFIVSQQGNTSIVIDFDMRKSLHSAPGLGDNYILHPTLRLVDESLVGRIAGWVDLDYLAETMETDSCSAGVYLFEGGEVAPDDLDGDADDGADPLLYKKLLPFEVGGTMSFYVLPFLEQGDYTVAFTCDYAVDALPDESEYDPNAIEGENGFETMSWTKFDYVYVEAEEVTELNYVSE